MTSFGFYQGISDLYKEEINLVSDSIRCALLTNAYTPDQTDQFFSDVSAYEIVGGSYNSILLVNKSVYTNGAQAIFDADDITDWQDDIFTGARYILIYNDTGVAATSQLIALIDFGGARNAPLTVPWNASGIFGFNSKTSTFNVTDFEDATDPLTDWTYSGNDWDEQVDPRIVPLTSDAFDAITGTWEHYVDCETDASPYGFDTVTDVNGQLDVQGNVYKEGSNSLAVNFDGTGTVAYGGNSMAGVYTTFISAFWVNFEKLTLSTNGHFVDFSREVGAGDYIIRVTRVDANTYRITAFIRTDSATYTSENVLDFSPGEISWKHFIVIWMASSAPAADDGAMHIFIDGNEEASIMGVDNDTRVITQASYGAVNINGTPSGNIYLDEIYDDQNGAPLTVAIQQMQGRDYSMCIPNIATSSYGELQLSPTVEIWGEFDWKQSYIESDSYIASLYDNVSGSYTLYIEYNQSTDQIRFVYKTDGGSVNGDWHDIGSDVTIGIYWRASSGAGNDDGEVALYFDGVLQEIDTGIDNDTYATDRTRFGFVSGTETGVHFYGTMRYSANESVISIKDWAAQSGSYGLAQYISPSAGTSELYQDFTATGTFSYEFDIDINNLVMAAGDEFILARFYDTGGATTIVKTSLKNNGGTYQLLTEYWDGGAFQNVSTYSFPAGKTAKIRVVWSEEPAAANDGWIFVYIDGDVDGYATGISTTQTDGDRFEITTVDVDAGTYGVVFLDNISFSSNEVMLNPLESSLNNPILITGDFEDDATPELEDLYFFIFAFSLGYKAPTQERKPTTQTPSVSDYKVRLKDQSGEIVAEFDNWISLNFNHSQNHVSNCRFEIDGRDSRKDLFETDGQIEVWRKNDSVDLPWYIEWEGLVRTPNKLITPGDDKRYVAHSISYLHLTKRSSILWDTGSSQAQKSGIGETIIKEIISENLGSLALAASGRWKDHVYPGLSVEADGGRGDSWDGEIGQKNVLSVLRDIATATGLVYNIVGIGGALYEFQIYEGQRGEDRSLTTGTDPLIFSTGYGNMITPLLTINRGDEITSVVVVGQGTEDDIQKEVVQSTAVNDSPLNDIESVLKNTKLTTTDELRKAGLSKLEENKKIERLSFEIEQIKSAFYGKDYSWGTKVTAVFEDYQEDIIFDKVDILVNKESSQERIRTELSNKNKSDVQEVE